MKPYLSHKLLSDDILCVYDKIGKVPARRDYQKYGKYNYTSIQKYFGSWSNALKRLSLNGAAQHNRQYSKEELLKYLIKFKKEFGYAPSKYDLANTEGYPTDKSYRDAFGTLGAAVKKAGLKESKRRIIAQDNHFYDSKEEASVANYLLRFNVNYEPHKRVCEHRMWCCDFYLPKYNLWVEYDGMGETRPANSTYFSKIDYYKKNKYNYLILSSSNWRPVLRKRLGL